MTNQIPSDAYLAEEAEQPELVRAKIISETARISWLELQKFFAAGSVVTVSPEVDLIAVAYAFSRDEQLQVAQWLQSGQVSRTTEEQAQQWYQQRAELWAVVISPWVLVQDKPLEHLLN